MKKKWLKTFAVGMLLFAILAIGAFAADGLTGDVDGSGRVTTYDAIACIKGIAEQTADEACDVNGDGTIDVLDAMAVVQIVVKQADCGFSVLPKVTADPATGYDRLTGTPSLSGSLYYYYTDTAEEPASIQEFVNTFNSIGSASSYTRVGVTSVVAGDAIRQSLRHTASVSGYDYVVMAIYYRTGTYAKPIVVKREAAKPIESTPLAIATLNGYDYLTGTPAQSGTIYYYYTDVLTVMPTVASFWSSYSAADSTHCGSISAYAGTPLTNAQMKPTATVSGCRYAVVMLVPADGSVSSPQLIVRGALPSNPGFSVAPKITADAALGYDMLSATPSVTGTIYYYYTNTAAAPTAASEFVTNFNSVGSSSSYALVGTVAVTAGSAINRSLKSTATVSSYKYVVMAIYYSDGLYTTPVIATRNTLTSTTFSITSSGTHDYLNGTPAKTGTIYYYYAVSAIVPAAASDFWIGYNGSVYNGSVSAAANVPLSNAQMRPTAGVTGYNYVIVMLVGNDGSTTTPQRIVRGGNVTSTFKGAALYSIENNVEYITATPAMSGTLYWYYTTLSTVPATGSVAFTNWVNASTLRGSEAAVVNTAEKFTLKSYADVYPYNYIVAFIGYSNGLTTSYTMPVLISKTNSTVMTHGFTATPTLSKSNGFDYLNATPTVSGTIQYYYTNNSTTPTTTTFETIYDSAAQITRGVLSATANVPLTGNNAALHSETALPPAQYRYVVIRLLDSTGTIKYAPVVLVRQTAAVTGTGFTSVPVYSLYGGTIDAALFMPAVTGTMYWYYTTLTTAPTAADYNGLYNAALLKNSLSVSSLTSQTVYLKAVADRAGYTHVVFQMVDFVGNRYTPVVVSVSTVSTTNGFTGGPFWTSYNGYDYVSGTTASVGKLHFYYTNIANTPDPDGFLAAYTAAPGGYKGQFSVPTPTFGAALFASDNVSSFKYIVIMFEDGNGTKYKPVVLTRVTTAVDTGFVTSDNAAPFTFLSNDGEGSIYLQATPSTAGKLFFYLSDSTTVADFDTGYNGAAIKGIQPVVSSLQRIKLGTSTTLAPYTHVIVRMQSADNTVVYQPLAVSLVKLVDVPGHEEEF
ncbi:MAG: hypothetical protein E7655_07055 [Ruminococcaceae bacterium]|nr:hypothetical protein [Oscillospiraceae bacterium]